MRSMHSVTDDVDLLSRPGLLPADLAATSVPVSRRIDPGDEMRASTDEGYLTIGESALKSIRLALIAARRPDPMRILDLPCGHGRVLRWLSAGFPDASLTACDLLADGVSFCAEEFGAVPVVSTGLPTAEAFDGPYDLIWVGSLLTHLNAPDWDAFLDLFCDLLAPGGVLVVTTHGDLVATRMRAGHLYGHSAATVARGLVTYQESGFAFLESGPNGTSYGTTVARPSWVVERLLRQRGIHLAFACEALWSNHQDVFAVVKGALDLAMPERPST